MSDGQKQLPQEALDLKRFLSDEIAPMIFADSFGEMAEGSPRLIAVAIRSWVADQYRSKSDVSIPDYLFHAAKKLHLLGELELIPHEQMDQLMTKLKPLLLSICPEADRDALAHDLENLEASEGGATSSPVDVVHRRGGGTGGGAAPGAAGGAGAHTPGQVDPSPSGVFAVPAHAHLGQVAAGDPGSVTVAVPAPVVQGLQRLNLLLDRLAAIPGVAGVAGAGASPVGFVTTSQEALVAEIVDEVASKAKSPAELEKQLAMLRQLGVSQLGDGLLPVLTRGLPDWASPVAAAEAEPTSGAVRAMRKFVALAPNRDEAHKRFAELVRTAVEQFNTGSLGRAVTILDLADRMLESGDVDRSSTLSSIDQAFAAIDQARMRELAEREDSYSLLRRFISFFPQLDVDELVHDLEHEEARDRRRFLLSLLTVHGDAARGYALARLADSISGNNPSPWYLERNLVHLLRTIPRAEGESADPEIDVFVKMSEPTGPPPLVREAMTALSQVRHDRADRTLIARVAELEGALLGQNQLPHETEDVESMLDSAVTLLARSPNPAARRAVYAHGIKRQNVLGDTAGRLAKLGAHDLSDDPELVARIVKGIQDELPTKLFGVAVKTARRSRLLEGLVEALAGTDQPGVRRVLSDVSQRFPAETFGQAATRVLARLGKMSEDSGETRSGVASLTGDLAVFGLPNLLQNLSDSRLTGALSLIDPDGETFAEVNLVSGLVQDARSGRLTGQTAIYELFERPAPGRFVFVQQGDDVDTEASTDALMPVTPLLLEGMRRYDEFIRAAAMIPDDASYKATDRKPTNVPDGGDPQLARQVWQRASVGAPPSACEEALAVDAFQIRRLFEHWVAEGSLAAEKPASREATERTDA
jgi:hypothetical protein